MAQSENYVYASGSPWKLGGLKKRELARRAWRELLTDDVLGRAAQLAYFFLFALFPLGIFLSALLAAFAGPRSALAHRMTGDILRMIPAPASALVSKIIHESLVKAGNGKLVFGIVVALFSASSGMAAMMDTLNTVFDVSEARSVLRQRIVAVLLTVGLGALICAAMLLITVGHKIAGAIGSGVLDWIWEVLQYPVAILFLLLAFSMIYRFAPHIRGGHWRAFTPGAVTGLCLCIAASLALRVYLQHFNGYSDYGTIGAVMVLMLWFYATGLAFLIGGEIDAIIDRAGSGRMKHGGRESVRDGGSRRGRCPDSSRGGAAWTGAHLSVYEPVSLRAGMLQRERRNARRPGSIGCAAPLQPATMKPIREASQESNMSIDSFDDLAGMEHAGKVTRAVIDAMKAEVQPGVTTQELDEVGAAVIRRHRARSAPQMVYGFPGHNCISVNDEIVHGIPGSRKLVHGDLVKLDVTVELNGYMADACETVPVGSADAAGHRLIDCASRAFAAGLTAARPGAHAFDIGREIYRTVRAAGYSVVRGLYGHGIGKTIHELPTIPNEFDPRCSEVLTEGLVFTIEPMIAAGDSRTVTLKDGWTVRTRDRSRSAHYEHTIVLLQDGPRLLTA